MIDTVPTALFGAAAALSLGLADFLARIATARLGPNLTAAAMYVGGAVLFFAAAAALGASFPATGPALASAVGSGLAGSLGILCFYTAISRGQLSFVIPIAGTYPVWSILYTTLGLGRDFGPVLLAAMIVTLAGVAVVARYGVVDAGSGGRIRAGVAILAVLGSVLFTTSLHIAEPAVAAAGALGTIAVARAVGGLILALAAMRSGAGRPSRIGLLVALAMAALDGVATLLVLLVIVRAENTLAIVVSSAFGVVTVLLARIFLAERINRLQWLGIMMALGGAAAISAFGA